MTASIASAAARHSGRGSPSSAATFAAQCNECRIELDPVSRAYDHGSLSTSLAHRIVPSLRRMFNTKVIARSTIGQKRSTAARSSEHCQWCHTPAAT